MTLPLTFYNSLTRSLERFTGPRDGETVRLYTCGPTVYNYQHIGNMRAFLFADTLGRTLRWFGYQTRHVINITDVGHLTSDADAGDDKMERAAAAQQQSIREVADFYTAAFKKDVQRLKILEPDKWALATDYIEEMKSFAERIEDNGYAYVLSEDDAPGAAGLYFDVRRLGGAYGKLARAETEAAKTEVTESRIDLVAGKRNAADFALWRATPPGEKRQMEWSSRWGAGAPGWHLECSVMSDKLLGHQFDIHTGGIDHREIHHPNEIAQNQAYCACADTGADIWMHNNFLVDRRGKMSKSTGEFLTLQALVDRGYHPLTYRLMCLQAHYRSEMEFTWEGLAAASVRLKRWVAIVEQARARDEDAYTLSMQLMSSPSWQTDGGAMKSDSPDVTNRSKALSKAIADDLSTPGLLSLFDANLRSESAPAADKLELVARTESLFGLGLMTLTRLDLRLRPADASIEDTTVEARLTERREARAAKDFARSDAIRDELAAAGVEVMDGDPLGWDWKLA